MKFLPSRKSDANKGDFGHVLVIGGDFGMAGAVIMAAEAACRAGAGRVTVLTHPENFTPLLARVPNVMTVSEQKNPQEIFAGKTVIAMGCGLGKTKWGRDLFELAMQQNLPKIIDADALNILAEGKKNYPYVPLTYGSGFPAKRGAPRGAVPYPEGIKVKNYDLSNAIITPHPGEAARLLGLSTDEIQANRQSAAEKLRQKFGAIVVLKGEGTLVLGKNLQRCNRGNPGMACAGMGDVLTGIIAGLVVQNSATQSDLEKAAFDGVNIHALCGDLVAKEQGEIGMMPTDFFSYIPRIINDKI